MAELKQFKREEIAKGSGGSTRMIIHDKIYDVTQFLNEHPGGEEVLLDQAGKDASEDWDDVGHSTDAQQLMKKYLIGELVKEERTNSKPKAGWSASPPKKEETKSGSLYLFQTIVGGIVVLLLATWYVGIEF